MIDFETIKFLSQKYQTRMDNVVREYFLHLFCHFYTIKKNRKIYISKEGRL